VRSRSGAGDATASVGIFQVTPIEQLNSKSARIGTTAATPADGEIIVTRDAAYAAQIGGTSYHLKLGQYTDGSSPRIDAIGSSTSLIFAQNGVEKMRFANGGTVSYAPLGNNKSILIDTPTATSVPIVEINDANSLTTGNIMYLRSDTSDTGVRSLVKIHNDHAGSTGTTALEVVNDSTGPAISATGGIVETNGVLKSNLLTNSGFDVWSNSTLETVATTFSDDMSADNTSNWTAVADIWLFDTDHYELGRSTNDARASITATGLVAGKLYTASVEAKDGSATDIDTWLTFDNPGSLPAADRAATKTTNGSYQEISFTFEAAATTQLIYIWLREVTGSDSIDLRNFTLKEVTPGCVAVGQDGPDGWLRDPSDGGDVYRQHDDSTYTKNGSFYSLKQVKRLASAEYILWSPGGTLPPKEESLLRFRGRTVTIGAWVYSVSAADNVKLAVYNHSGFTVSSAYAGADAWEWMELTVTINTSATNFSFGVLFDGDASDVAYISQPMLVFGSAIGSGNYSRPMGEIIYNEVDYDSVTYPGDGTLTSNTTFNSEAESLGRIPKGAKALNVNLIGSPDAVGSYEAHLQIYDPTWSTGLRTYGNVVGNRITCAGWVKLNSAGEYRVGKNQNFSELKLTFLGVQM
jgi:hypothetical protein